MTANGNWLQDQIDYARRSLEEWPDFLKGISSMKLGDLPLKHLRPGIRMHNAQKTQLGTLKHNVEYAWYVEWDNGNKSVMLDITDERAEGYYDLEVVTKLGKIVIDNEYNIGYPDVYIKA
jgi:hypothetical protein